jgi:CDP-glucose 4,6-dehydratase
MGLDPAFWSGRRVLVTGHTGFKGSWLALWLEELGAEVTGFALAAPTEPSLFELARVAESVTSIEGDVRDLDAVVRAVAESEAEVVIHMAAQPLVRRSFAEPVETYATNVMGTVHVLEAVRRAGGVRVAVNVTSDKCYENRNWEWGYREDEPKGGYDPYSNSKGCSELVTSAYRSSFFGEGTALGSARAGNVIGGGDWSEDRLVPDAMRAAIERTPLLIRNPNATRPWQHVLDPLEGYLMLAQALWESREFADGWNFGPEDRDAREVGWIVESLSRRWDGGIDWRQDGGDHPHEASYLKLDSSRARAHLGWQPGWSLEDALDAVVDWYRRYAAGEDAREVTLAQLRSRTSATSR